MTAAGMATPLSKVSPGTVRWAADDGARPGPPRETEPAESRDDQTGAFVPFEGLLGMMRDSHAAQRTFTSNLATPQQMFEPAPGDRHQRRLSNLKSEYRRAVDEQATPQRQGRAAAEAKVAAGNGPGARLDAVSDARLPGSVRSSADQGLPGDATRDHAVSLGRGATGVGGPARLEQVDVHSRGRAATDGEAAVRPAPSGNVPVAGAVNGNARSAAVPTAGTSSATPAAEVGRILAAESGSETGLPRPQMPAWSGSASTTKPQDGRHPPDRSEARVSSSQAEPAAVGDSDGKVNEPATSPFAQLVRALRLGGGLQQSSARMWLEPPELGRMHVDVRVTGKQVRIGVRTQTTAARDRLAGRATELTAALRQQGITVERFDVLVDDLSGTSREAAGGGSPAERPSGRSPLSRRAGSMVARDGSGERVAAGWAVPIRRPFVAEPRLDVRA